MPVYEDGFIATIKEFKECLYRNDMLIRDFAIQNGHEPATFSAAINRHANLSDEMRQEILDYIKADKKEEEEKAQSKEV